MAVNDWIYWIALVLVIVGGLNWLLVGLLNLDIVAAIFGAQSIASRVVYVLVGLSAIYLIFGAYWKTTRTRVRSPA